MEQFKGMTLALSKGRIYQDTIPLLRASGIIPLGDPDTTRELIIPTNRPDLRLVIVRASDVPTYVRYGGAHLGVAGKDVILEQGCEGLYQPLDLGIAQCRLMGAVPETYDYHGAVRKGTRLRVATKYENLARKHFAQKGVHVDLIKLYGSMELAPLIGLADGIVDLVSSGKTLQANHLKAVELVAPISAHLVVNVAAWKWGRVQLEPLVNAFAWGMKHVSDQ